MRLFIFNVMYKGSFDISVHTYIASLIMKLYTSSILNQG